MHVLKANIALLNGVFNIHPLITYLSYFILLIFYIVLVSVTELKYNKFVQKVNVKNKIYFLLCTFAISIFLGGF